MVDPVRRPMAVWILGGLSLLLSIVGLFWLRLWIPGMVLGVVAFVLSLVAARRAGRRPVFADAGVMFASLALALPLVIALVTLAGAVAQTGSIPRETLQVELRVRAEGDFTVSYTEPVEPGASTATTATVEATDEFEKSYTTDQNTIQFFAAIVQDNIGPQEITCTITVNGEVVLENTGDKRYVDCTAELQKLAVE
jgi:hypothetical protein